MSKDKQSDIINAALQLFAERGYDGTTVPMIAKRAAVGAGTIYHYYENKEALVNSLFIHCVSNLAQVITQDYPADITDTEKQFTHIYYRLFHFAMEHKESFLFMTSHNDGHYLDESSKKTFQDFLSFFIQAIQRGQERGHIRNLESHALIAIVYSPVEMIRRMFDLGELTYSEELYEAIKNSAWDAIRII